jgi:hypothetical protein
METITIQVDAEVAKAYREVEPQKRQNATLVFNLFLKELLKHSSFEEIVQQIRDEAAANGLTSEILAQLLKDA